MGLDMYLSAKKYVSGYSHSNQVSQEAYNSLLQAIGLDRSDVTDEAPSGSVTVNVAYWRKANAIHNWFIENVADGVDDCQPMYVSRDELQALCKDIEGAIAGQVDPDDEEALDHEDVLPTADGFFFGGTDYDEYYWGYLERTLGRISDLLTNEKFADFDFEYRASW